MVIVLTGVHKNLFDPRVLFLLIVASDRPAYRRCLDELWPGADYANDFHSSVLNIFDGVRIFIDKGQV
jgi:hypothetical protein